MYLPLYESIYKIKFKNPHSPSFSKLLYKKFSVMPWVLGL